MIVCVLQLSFSLLYLVNLFVLWKHVFLFAELFQWKISAKISLQFTCELSLNLVTEQYPPWWYLDSAVCSVWISSLECKRRMKEAGRGNFTQRLHCSCVYCKKQETDAGWELMGHFENCQRMWEKCLLVVRLSLCWRECLVRALAVLWVETSQHSRVVEKEKPTCYRACFAQSGIICTSLVSWLGADLEYYPATHTQALMWFLSSIVFSINFYLNTADVAFVKLKLCSLSPLRRFDISESTENSLLCVRVNAELTEEVAFIRSFLLDFCQSIHVVKEPTLTVSNSLTSKALLPCWQVQIYLYNLYTYICLIDLIMEVIQTAYCYLATGGGRFF